jgi:hypothetical protein
LFWSNKSFDHQELKRHLEVSIGTNDIQTLVVLFLAAKRATPSALAIARLPGDT